MIEFTMSRVAVFICGAILLAAIAIPVADQYDRKEIDGMIDVADNITYMIDSFWESEADVMTVRGWDILPSPDYSASLNGHSLTLSNSEGTFTSLISHAAEPIIITYDDIISIERNGETIIQTQ